MNERMTEIAAKADFELIRYAQAWEDADVLTAALGEQKDARLVSIASAGDNALALLTLDPAEVAAVDISAAQIECVRLRMAAYRTLDHAEFLELMGARASKRRGALLARVLGETSGRTAEFWSERKSDVAAYGAAGVGKFERYFRHFRRFILSMTHSRSTREDIFQPRSAEERAIFFDKRFDNWRWRVLMRLFFSRFMMARLGRDPAFFEHVEGSVADHVTSRLRHAGVVTDPSQNPYLHWIFTGTHGSALPLAWRPEHYNTILDRLDRVTLHQMSLEEYLSNSGPVDGYNLSDIFEYMGPEAHTRLYARLLENASTGARLVYWNMMVPRRAPDQHRSRIASLSSLEEHLKAKDKAFFYSDLVIEEVR